MASHGTFMGSFQWSETSCAVDQFETWRNRTLRPRHVAYARDVVDWVGGYPFEVAKPEEIFEFYESRGFKMRALKTDGGKGCNEFLFVKT